MKLKIVGSVISWLQGKLSPEEHSDHLYHAVDDYLWAQDQVSDMQFADPKFDAAILYLDGSESHLRALRDWYKEQK